MSTSEFLRAGDGSAYPYNTFTGMGASQASSKPTCRCTAPVFILHHRYWNNHIPTVRTVMFSKNKTKQNKKTHMLSFTVHFCSHWKIKRKYIVLIYTHSHLPHHWHTCMDSPVSNVWAGCLLITMDTLWLPPCYLGSALHIRWDSIRTPYVKTNIEAFTFYHDSISGRVSLSWQQHL